MNRNSIKPNSLYLPFTVLKRTLFFIMGVFLLVLQPAVGQNLQDLQQLKKELEAARSAREAGILLDTASTNYGLPTRILYKSKDLEAYYRTKLGLLKTEFETLSRDLDSLTAKEKLRYFGYDLFSNRDTIQMWQNLPLPKDYVLGPGDEVIISLWGEVERFNRTIIGREGTIYLSDVGQISLAGKTLAEATPYLKKRLSRIYATLKGNRPSTFLDLSLGKLKGINVQFLGYVKQPGVYTVHPFSTVIMGLIQAGGVDTTGSLRHIQVYRDGKEVTEVDLYTFLNTGQPSGDVKLRDQDVVFVPSRLSTVAVNGSVFRSGYYELKPGETLADLVAFAGNLKPEASSEALLQRIVPIDKRGNNDEVIFTKQTQIKDLGDINALNGDSLVVPAIFPNDSYVSIFGRVKSPGEYPLTDSMHLSDLLSMAGGLQDTNWLKTIDLTRAELVRWDNETGARIKRTINIAQVFKGDPEHDVLLKAFDQISIYKNPTYGFEERVKVTGEVNIPGEYPIMGRSLDLIIAEAGGLTPTAFEPGIKIFRDTVQVGWHSFQYVPVSGDSIYVPPRPGTVKIEGAVHHPGFLAFKENRKLKDYLELAGGLTSYADKRKIYIIYPNGEAMPKERFSNPKVPEGSTIVVSENKAISPTNYLDVVQRLASIAGSLATLILVVRSTP